MNWLEAPLDGPAGHCGDKGRGLLVLGIGTPRVGLIGKFLYWVGEVILPLFVFPGRLDRRVKRQSVRSS